MKKFLAVAMAVAMLLAMSTMVAFAESLYPGEVFYVDGFEDKNGNAYSGSISKEYNSVRASYSSGKTYVDQPYIDDDGNVCIKAKLSASVTSDKDIEGIVTLTDIDTKERFTVNISFTVMRPEDIKIMEVDNKRYELPESYQNGKVVFRAYGEEISVGKLNCKFHDPNDFNTVAYFDVTIADQPSLFLFHESTPDMDILRKYENANLDFLRWTTTPKFDKSGTLGIVMEKDEFLYVVNSDKSLSAASGKYNGDRGVFEMQTATLGSYVISDVKLSGTGSAASTAPPASSTTPPPASSVAPPSTASSVAPPVVSSVAPPPASSLPASSTEPAPSESSEESAPEESSSEPVSEPESSESSEEDSSSTAVVPKEEEGGFPLVPVVVGVGVVLVGGVAAYFIFANKKNGKKNYDSWDD